MEWKLVDNTAGTAEVWLLPSTAKTPVYVAPEALPAGGSLWLEPRREADKPLLLCRLAADTPEAARNAAGDAGRHMAGFTRGSYTLCLSALPVSLLPPALQGFLLGAHRVTRYLSAPGKAAECTVLLPPALGGMKAQTLLDDAVNEVSGVLLARTLVADTASDLPPLEFAARMRARFKGSAVQVDVLKGEALAKARLAGLVAVGKGSQNPPCLIVLRLATKPGAPLTALVGKGVTFDMGGMNVKTAADLSDARMDMGGAAAVAGAFDILERACASANLIGVLACAENVPDAAALLPGEVLTFMDGTTVQVTNTDAEGRLLLADALLYAQKQGAKTLVDLATLTGNVGAALGMEVAAVLGDDGLCARLCAAGRRTGDALWQLPLVQRYAEEMKSDYADMKSTASTPLGGCIKAGLFLQHFVKEGAAWAHIDMANTVQAKSAWGYRPVGPTGYGAALLADYVREMEP